MQETNYLFERDGFTVIRQMFTEKEVARIKTEIQQVLEKVKARYVAEGKNPTEIAHHGVFVGLAANSPFFWELAGDPRLVNALEPIYGPDIEFLSDKVVFKSANVDFGSPWHQDWPYWKGAHKVSIWIALDPATPENGCLKMLPGSHKQVIVHDGQPTDGTGFVNRLRAEAVDESQAVILPAEPGDAVVFHDLTVHASFPNTTGKDRWALVSTYRSAKEPDLEYEWAVAAHVVRGTKRSGELRDSFSLP